MKNKILLALVAIFVVSHEIIGQDTKPAQPSNKVELIDEDKPDIDPNENLGPDSRWIGSVKIGLGNGDVEGLAVDYYFWNSPDSMHHFAGSLGVDTQQFLYFFPSAEIRYELGKNHRFSTALRFHFTGIQDITEYAPETGSNFSRLEDEAIFSPTDSATNDRGMSGLSFLLGYTHQGNNKLFFSIAAGLSWIFLFDPAFKYYPDHTEIVPCFTAKLGFRFQ